MKYGHEYSEALASAEFPADWVSAAISYRDLKKGIKKIQKELLDFGLDAEILKNISSSFGTRRPSLDRSGTQTNSRFVPELWIATNNETGQFLDAGLTDETKDYFSRTQPLGGSQACSPHEITNVDSDELQDAQRANANIRWTQIPLSTVTSFFDALDPKLAQLDAIQQIEAHRLEGSIVKLGQAIQELTEPKAVNATKYKARADVDTWRDLFALYLDSTVFFSSHEQDHGVRNYSKAKQNLQLFSDRLVQQGLVKRLKRPESRLAFERFVSINMDILRVMRFQEINAMAVRKILKKFDKRTALGASRIYSGSNFSGPFARSIAKDMCSEVSSKVIAIVPQLDDYTCPICYSLAWRPIRLGCCNSIFCIRCVIQLQKETKDKCPMCRQPTIMLADASYIDDKTAAYLMRYFPKEVKQRQRENERAAGVDKYGESFYKSRCTVM